jgi:alpha-mannosidase
MARTGKVYLKAHAGNNISVVNSAGMTVPFQLQISENDSAGNLATVDVTFVAENVPSLGYDTYYLKFMPEPVASPKTALAINEAELEMENSFVRVRVDPTHGGLVSLVEKKSQMEFISPEKFSTPAFHGQPNLTFPFLEAEPDRYYDSTAAHGEVTWLQKGPLQATVKAVHKWKQLTFETQVTLYAHSPRVEVLSRVLTKVPPATDPRSAKLPGDYPRAERNIHNGYWLAFAPGFATESVHRDFPLGSEATKHDRVHGLTYVDLLGADRGLLVVHSGCQYFRKEEDGTWSNLVMREWESEFSDEYGFPNYVEFTHSLLAHGLVLDSAERARAAMECDCRPLTATSYVNSGQLPTKKSFLRVSPDNVLVSAFRRRSDGGYELRLLETAGRAAEAKVELGFAASIAVETNLHGQPTDKPVSGKEIALSMKPWQFRTLQIV